MGLLSLIGAKQRVTFLQAPVPGQGEKPIFTIDCTVRARHHRKSPVTKFAVEDGSMVNDHALVGPFGLDIDGIISDTPISALGAAITTAATAVLPAAGIVAGSAAFALYKALAGSQSPSVAAYGALLKLQAQRQPFTVITSLQRYPSMLIEDLDVPQDAGTGDSLVFHLQLSQVTIVSPQTVNIQQFSNPSLSAGTQDAGTQALQNKGLSAAQQGVSDGLQAVGAGRAN